MSLSGFWIRMIGVFLLCCVLFVSCDVLSSVGMGAATDLDGPVLTVTSHANMDYVPLSFLLEGKCKDESGVDRVVVSSADTGVVYGNASVNGEDWSIRLSLPEGERTVRITAYDVFNNSSYQSVAQLTFLVDATPPFLNRLYVERMPGYSVELKSRDELAGYDASLSNEMDYIQNGFFKVRAEVEENFRVSEVVLHVLDEFGEEVFAVSPDDGSPASSPVFTLRDSDFFAVDSSYALSRHYFRLTVSCRDIGGNENTDQGLWFSYDPEADVPRIVQGNAVGGVITVPQESVLPFTFFDDDGLDVVYAAVVSLSDWNSVPGSSDEEKLDALEGDELLRTSLMGTGTTVASGRSVNVSVSAPSSSGSFKLVALVRDKKLAGYGDWVWKGQVYELRVTDADEPLAFISSPQENIFPSLSGGSSFSIEGYCLDNSSVVSARLAWIPAGIAGGADSHVEDVKNFLAASSVSGGQKEVLSDGVVIWGLPLSSPVNEVVGGRTYKRYSFSLSLDVLSDFVFAGGLENDRKLFVLFAEDDSGNYVFSTFVLSADNSLPDINVSSPATDYEVLSQGNDLVLSFSADKSNGLPVSKVSLYDVSSSPVLLNEVSASSLSYTVPAASLAEGQWVYRFVAEDVLGNVREMERTVIVSAQPVLEYIGSPLASGVYKAGSDIFFEVVFSDPVSITGSPRLGFFLDSSVSGAPDAYADYVSGAGSSTLIFSYNVPAGVSSDKLFMSAAPLDLSGGSVSSVDGSSVIIGALSDSDLIQGRKDIALDAVAPQAVSLSCASGAYRAGDKLVFTLGVDSPVLINGDVKLLITAGSTRLEAAVDSVTSDSVVFSCFITDGLNTSSLAYDSSALLSDSSLITDYAGNVIDLSSLGAGVMPVIIDTSAPSAPIVDNQEGVFNSSQTISISGVESNAVVEYSLDGGLSWNDYDAGNPPVLFTDGFYLVTARQIDAAGNVSANAVIKNITIDTGAPSVVSVSCTNPDGVYPAGSEIRFKVSFSEKVRTTGGGAYLSLGAGYHADVLENSTGSSVLYFVFTVPDGFYMSPLEPDGLVLTGVEDLFGNVAPASLSATELPDIDRPALIADAVAPSVESTVPSDGMILSSGQDSISIVFSEPVFKESGTIVIKRSPGWLIPPVMTEDEFRSVYYSSLLSSVDREILMQTANGSPALDSLTAQPLGPYRKLTHGLVQSGTSYVPDLSTKYVLAFDRGLDDADIRAVMEKAGYHILMDVDVTSYRVSVSGSTVTISLPSIQPGIKWDVNISAGSFRDSAGNSSSDISFSFFSGGVAAPVIRVDRYSHGEGAVEPVVTPSGDGLTGTITGSVTIGGEDTTTEPSGFVRIRIDSQTLGANIRYLVTDDDSIPGEPVNNYVFSHSSYTDFLAVGKPLSPGQTEVSNADDAQRIFIKAIAEHTELGSSSYGVCGAYKTLVVLIDPGRDGNPLQMQGSIVAGAPPTVPGFPLRDADPDQRYSKYAYAFSTNDWLWLSWDIVSSWVQTSYRGNWQRNYNQGSYGKLIFVVNQLYW
ncbi:hypothetical protein WKV44_02215 [Spirochaetia bacterium 38H-sp]|uniref:SbsA Ig-like domain-containing protein n=1 Tax=Rarispira pelagica TaxID=3141764 RepID=A0ABU9UBJ2_9SPIR